MNERMTELGWTLKVPSVKGSLEVVGCGWRYLQTPGCFHEGGSWKFRYGFRIRVKNLTEAIQVRKMFDDWACIEHERVFNKYYVCVGANPPGEHDLKHLRDEIKEGGVVSKSMVRLHKDRVRRARSRKNPYAKKRGSVGT